MKKICAVPESSSRNGGLKRARASEPENPFAAVDAAVTNRIRLMDPSEFSGLLHVKSPGDIESMGNSVVFHLRSQKNDRARAKKSGVLRQVRYMRTKKKK